MEDLYGVFEDWYDFESHYDLLYVVRNEDEARHICCVKNSSIDDIRYESIYTYEKLQEDDVASVLLRKKNDNFVYVFIFAIGDNEDGEVYDTGPYKFVSERLMYESDVQTWFEHFRKRHPWNEYDYTIVPIDEVVGDPHKFILDLEKEKHNKKEEV